MLVKVVLTMKQFLRFLLFFFFNLCYFIIVGFCEYGPFVPRCKLFYVYIKQFLIIK